MNKRLFSLIAVLAMVFSATGKVAFGLHLPLQLESFSVEGQDDNHVKLRDRLPLSPRVPEPDTLLLLFGGMAGVLARFIRKSFEEVKRWFDIVLSFVGLAISFPILLYAAVMIKYDSPGPVIYRQRRVGREGKVFEIYKLRTMRVDAEKGTGAVWAAKDDPRVTKVGRVLRKLRVDEIPQLYNVLKGDMSIIGPRPERPEIVNRLRDVIQEYDNRLKVKPGITGLAQVLYKYDESLEDVKNKVRFDQLYMRNMSVANDLRILARTFLVVATGRGAR